MKNKHCNLTKSVFLLAFTFSLLPFLLAGCGNPSGGGSGSDGTTDDTIREKIVAAGELHSIALMENGTLWAWGSNWAGQLGDGTITDHSYPVQVMASPGIELSGVKAIATGVYHTLALMDNGSLWAWGNNAYGQLGVGTIYSYSSYPVQVIASLGIGLSGVKAIAAGSSHTLALMENGDLWAWGRNYAGQLGDGTTTDSSYPVQVLASPGIRLSGIKAIATGYEHNLALMVNGSLWAWGRNNAGQLGDGTTIESNHPIHVLSGVKIVAPGYYHSLALMENGSLWAWGNNVYGQLGDGTAYSTSFPVQVMASPGIELSGVKAIATGYYHSLALMENGSLWAWGCNTNGELGDGTTTNSSYPVQVIASLGIGLSGVKAIAAGSSHTLALMENGSLWAWGNNVYGQLGDGTVTTRYYPVEVLP